MATPVIGIDLGTTNCSVACMRDGKMSLIADDQGQVLFPSVITVGENNRFWYGREAVALGAASPGRTAYAIKRLVGRRFADPVVQRSKQMYPYAIQENPSGGGVLIQLGDNRYTPEELSGMLLRHLVEMAAKRLGVPVRETVITVPAYFNHAQREATQYAAASADLSVLRLLNEPTAAALSLQIKDQGEQTVAVYDFGGGTFDISIIRVHETVYEVLATNGDTFLGGDDIDALLCDELSAEFQRATGVVLRDHPLSWHRLRDAAEKAKKELSLGERCAVYLPRLVAEHSFSTELSRQRLEELASPLLDRSLQICSRTLEQAGLKPADVDQLVLVGGQTRMPLMRRRVEDFFGRSPAPGVNPDTVVAEGAAREGAMLRQGTGVLLLDVTPITLGINIAGNRLYPIVPKNTKIPVRREHVFTTHRDAQARARMVIIQGDNPLASENTRLGEVVLNQLSGTERFQPRIHVAFEIDASGILKVLAKDEDSGEEREAVITDSWKPEGKERAGVTPEGETVTPASGGPVPTISGAFRETELVDVLFFLHANRKTGRVEVVTGERRGTIQLTEGEISHALADDQTGPQALRTLLAIKEGQFAFHEGPLPEGPREILEPFDQLV